MYYIYDENKAEFDKLCINDWHNAGKFGEGVRALILDNEGYPAKDTNILTPLPLKGTTGHLTHVSWVARMVMPKAQITALTMSNYESALSYVKEHKDEIDIINCSFHTLNPILREAMESAFSELDIPIICASGDNGEPSPLYPANSKYCIPFGAVNEKDGNTALWSPKGVYSTSYTNIKIPSYTGYFTGTSASSPMAFGCIGLVIGELKERGLKGYTREQAKKHIRMVSKDMYDKGYDNKSGYGLYRLPKVYELSYEDEAKGYGSAYFDYRQWR